MKIELNEVIKWLEYKSLINKAELKDIEWTKDGIPVKIPENSIEDWQFIGLNNIEYATNVLIPKETKRILSDESDNK